MNLKPFTAAAAAAGLVLLQACATSPPPIDLMNRVDAALKEAEQSGAGQHAPLELKFARQKYAAAQQAVSNDDNERARLLAEQALVNSQLAEAKADAAEARAAAQEVRKAVESLRDELLRMEEQG